MIDITEYEIMKNWKGDKNTPLVSICTITYNHEKYIAEALDSFLMQKTDFPIEIVIDDDCSTDDTAKVINKYIKKYPNIIRANFRSENVGMMANFIGNINKANGEYIALCEGDDYWIDKNKLSYQVEEMELHKKCDLSFHSAVELAGLNKGKIISNHSKSNKVFEVKDVILGGGEFCPTASLLFKKSVLTNLSDLMSKAPVGDHFIQIIAASSGGALFLSRAMSIYRVGHLESWLSNMKRLDKMSVIESIENRAKHTNKHINTLKKMKKFIDKKEWLYLDMKISDRLITLAILYLKNNIHDKFQESITRSKKYYDNNSISVRMLYVFRNFPKTLILLLKVRSVFIINK